MIFYFSKKTGFDISCELYLTTGMRALMRTATVWIVICNQFTPRDEPDTGVNVADQVQVI